MPTHRDIWFSSVTVSALLAIWLFFGCLALADQMQLIPESSAQDEQALLQLTSGLKPDVPYREGELSSSGCANVSVSLLLIALEGVSQEPGNIVRALPTLRLHQLVSVYRI